MICYIINWCLHMLAMVTCSAITCTAFESKNKKKKRWQHVLGLCLIQMPFTIMKYVYNDDSVLRTISFIMTAISCVMYMVIFLEGYLWQKILFNIFQAICSFTAEMISSVILNDELSKAGILSYESSAMVMYLIHIYIIFSLLFLLFLFVWKKLFSSGSYNLKIYFIFCIFPISQIIIMGSINKKIYEEFVPGDMITLLGILVGVLADVLLLATLLKQQSMQEMSIRINEIEKAWEIEQNHYREMEARREELAKIRHDLSEQYIVIQELLHRGEYDKAAEMLTILSEYVAGTKEYVYCADPIVNAIMAENEKICLRNNIRLDYNLEIIQPLKINPVAICSLFSNLMRNAIASASKGENRELAFVSIKAAVKGDYLHIKVENSYTEEKKQDKKERKGYGLDILKSLTERYHGQMDVIVSEGKYSTRISVENIETNERSSSY